ncbi:hypothetical protein DRF60_06720 [Chryseobacterium elymi]|uniref:Thioredoxin domain-containing protein n=1 Tax=Chryseobacterium elymi TaxID=395936 RepID=A0A3D9DNA1_9FLAO|nr:TlpA disulfide reductase family protein [Chryseobacterium elymi]REC79510.1 hypothetical protein DRF60_06720 [Chryseobacterium elymi]
MKILLTIISFFAVFNIVHSQSNKKLNNDLRSYFKVVLNENIVEDSVLLIYQDNQWGDVNGIPKSVVKNKVGRNLIITFKKDDPFIYGNLTLGEGNYIFSKNIIEPGDSIIFTVQKGKIEIDGIGKEKYQFASEVKCQFETLDQKWADSLSQVSKGSNDFTEINVNTMKKDLIDKRQINEEKKQLVLDLLEKYKPRLSAKIYDILKLDYLIQLDVEYLQLFNTDIGYVVFKKQENVDSSYMILDKIYNDYYKDQNINTSENFARSRSVTEFHSEKLRNHKFQNKVSFNSLNVVRYIINNYSGILRDRLLTIYLIRKKINSNNDYLAATDALKCIKTPYCRTLLENLKGNSTPGSKAFEFSLVDSLGKTVKQSDFKGKVVLLDFFFTGCGGCKILNNQMTDIVNYYSNNSNIQFISVNVDKDMEKWKNSLRTLEYTHKGSVDLFTNGLGSNAEIIRHYNIVGYPTLILIDKEGKIISTKPPRPYDEKHKSELIQLINSAL